ncbi:MAG: protein kinase [Myxococcota bacterium]|nr:protein kinase [Myxococcota bacterium]
MVDHALDPAALSQLEVHVDSCEPCRKVVALLALGSQPTVTPRSVNPWATLDAKTARYAIASVLGSGGMGRILSAFDRQLNRTVALKELHEARPDLEARFRREALLTARLEHPNIVSLHEAGTWPSGEPFYTMRLVSGRPLNQVLAEAKTFAERIALLPHVIAVADALAYAHQEGIIHRDLKPHNVMVGEFGETVVIDWGLAKDLKASSDEDSLPGAEPASDMDTRAGEVIGTPAYMPPEQAAGEVVDARADVYAIGAILYHLLAGHAPYSGKTGRAVVEAVRCGPPAPLDRRGGIPHDLIAIIERAMGREPEMRYATARELREDLRRFHSGQLVGAHRYTVGQLVRRWIGKHRTAVVVGAAALVALAAIAVISIRQIVREQRHAEAQRLLAVEHRAQAEDLTRFMLFDLKEKLEPIGKLELLDAVAKKATAYYDRQPASVTDDERRQRATVRHNLGDVVKSQGDLPGALAHYRAALAIRADLVARVPSDGEAKSKLAWVQRAIGDVLRTQGDAAGALAEYRSAMAIGEQLVAQDPTNAFWQREVSTSHDKIGRVLLAQGDAPGSLAAHRRALQIRQDQATKSPDNLLMQRNLAVGHSNVGDVLFATEDLAPALVEYRTALAIRERILAKDPTNAAVQRDLSVSHDNIGDVLKAKGDNPGALAAYRLSLVVVGKVASQDPTNATWQRDLVVAHDKVGMELRAQLDLKGALAEYRAALAIATQLAAKDPTNLDWQRDVVIVREHVGDVRLAMQDAAGALAEFRAVVPIKEMLAAKDPTNTTLQRDLSVSHAMIGDALRAQGKAGEALAEYRIDLAMTEKLAAQEPTDAGWRHDLSVSHSNIAKAFEALGKPSEARDEYRAALAIAEELAARDPNNAQWKQELVDLQRVVASCCKPR